MKHWYLVKTKSKQEDIAILNLENQNFHVYCPYALIRNKNEVLFPGYIFIQLDKDTQNWSPIRSTKGVLYFVRFGLSYAKIPDNIIEFIKTNQLNTAEKLKNINKFKSGDKVQITDGVFKNCIAIFKSYKSDERVILLMNILGQQQKLTIKQESFNAL
jgi:transcriptional antiterminator RfaH|tara:strand:- start:75 stop:548 length:474 start_codon:yes stop_codon:yes gene_type:complete